ncbi:unnamed protein product [Brassica rapa]|uniref:Uncharacterized protein n=1 Tax=Brassica campestris TaxID=3711 RepID=A0A3P5Y101_BRACM|nr:unnamed protein product [Brassica rapa]VDC61042.1 unnamed protein product [Brassica rapa]
MTLTRTRTVPMIRAVRTRRGQTGEVGGTREDPGPK